MKKQTLSQKTRRLLRPLLRPVNEMNAFIGSESAHELFENQGWNACIRRALSSGVVPKEKTKSKSMMETAKNDGWNQAVEKIQEVSGNTKTSGDEKFSRAVQILQQNKQDTRPFAKRMVEEGNSPRKKAALKRLYSKVN